MSKLVIPGVIAQSGNGGGGSSITPISPLQYQTTSEVVTETVPYNIYSYENVESLFSNPELQPTPYTSSTITMTEDDLSYGLLFQFNKGYQPQLNKDFRITGKMFVLNNPFMEIFLKDLVQEQVSDYYSWNENNLIDFYRYDEGDPITIYFYPKNFTESSGENGEELEIPCSEITGDHLLYEVYYNHTDDKVTFTFKQSDETLIGSASIENFSTKVELGNATSVSFWTNDIDYPEPIDGIYKFETIEVREVTTKNLELNYDDNTLAVTDGELTVIGGSGDSVIKDYEAPSYTVNTTLFTSPLPIPNLDVLTEAGTYRVHFDMDMEGTTTTVTYIVDVSPIKVSDTLFAYMQNLYVGPGAGDSVSIFRSGMLDGSSITWSDWSGNSIAEKQNKTLSSAITVGGVSQTTVEGALGAINTNTDGALKNTATGTNSLTILGTAATTIKSINIGQGSGNPFNNYIVEIGADSSTYGYGGVSLGQYVQNSGHGSIAIGHGARVDGGTSAAKGSIAIGGDGSNNASPTTSSTEIARVNGVQYAIQLGKGTNSTANSFQVFSYQMLDGNTGKIPAARLPIPQYTWYTGNTGTSITIVDTSNANLVLVYKNGLLLQPPTEDSDSDVIINDYSINGTTLTLTSELLASDKITVAVF